MEFLEACMNMQYLYSSSVTLSFFFTLNKNVLLNKTRAEKEEISKAKIQYVYVSNYNKRYAEEKNI